MSPLPRQSLRQRLALLMLPLFLAACGGGSGGADTAAPSGDCSLAGQKAWLGDYMNEWYFWYRLSPRPDPAPYGDVLSYFDALLYTGSSSTFPSDRWSGSQTTESFNRFYGDGSTLGYGLSVAALELGRDPSRPLYVRYVELLSVAATQGVQRGDQVMFINGQSAGSVVSSDDFSALSAQQAGDTLSLVLRRAGVDRSVTLQAGVYALSPVTGTTVLSSAGGRRIGYVSVKDMISQALAPLETAFSRFRAESVQDVVLDLRYNGGGLVSTGAALASYLAGTRGSGRNYASLLYNDKRANLNNQGFAFSAPSSAVSIPRVFVLIGRRTCSASEQVINGLRGAGVEVIAVGETSCGKPVGSLPASSCGRTYSVINFESVNHRNEGRYFDGFAPTCAVTENFRAAQGGGSDPLMNAALSAADTGLCPVVSEGRAGPLAAPRRAATSRHLEEGDSGQGMVPR